MGGGDSIGAKRKPPADSQERPWKAHCEKQKRGAPRHDSATNRSQSKFSRFLLTELICVMQTGRCGIRPARLGAPRGQGHCSRGGRRSASAFPRRGKANDGAASPQMTNLLRGKDDRWRGRTSRRLASARGAGSALCLMGSDGVPRSPAACPQGAGRRRAGSRDDPCSPHTVILRGTHYAGFNFFRRTEDTKGTDSGVYGGGNHTQITRIARMLERGAGALRGVCGFCVGNRA